eukprot:TRINITY_DN1313_c0_g1_i3.p1 TRINITY_DN1313_c0_g1~~TRINITY_DN1313_c0_g1_i3.p1  ORF type:complete len:160 (-),score=35.92 TRINITY_DN1313_c0_g1_i3:315-794(-)
MPGFQRACSAILVLVAGASAGAPLREIMSMENSRGLVEGVGKIPACEAMCAGDKACEACSADFDDSKVDASGLLAGGAIPDCAALLTVEKEGYPADCDVETPGTPLYDLATCYIDLGLQMLMKDPTVNPCGTEVMAGSAAPTMAPSMAPSAAPTMAPVA